MPELPEVETTMRALAARLAGRTVTGLVQRRADIRFPAARSGCPPGFAAGRVVRFARRAKFIECFLDDGAVLLLHLGMSGRLLFDGEPCGPHEHLTFAFDDGTILRFVDPRRFGMLDLWPAERARPSTAGWRISAWSRWTPVSTGVASRTPWPAGAARSRWR